MITDYRELLKKRRSIRDYEDKEVSMEVIQEILKEACFAPSACNRQPWKFIVIRNKDLIKRISDESKKVMAADIEKDASSSYKRFEKMISNPDSNVFYNTPCLVMVVGDKDYNWLREDCSLYLSYMMFAATARGLGSCWIALGEHIEDKNLRKEIGLNDELKIVAPIIMGYPKKIPEISMRKDPIILKDL